MSEKVEESPRDRPIFRGLGGQLYVVSHRRDDPLPIGSLVVVPRADGKTVLVEIKGRLALLRNSKAKYFEYIFKRSYLGPYTVDDVVDGVSAIHRNPVRRLDGVWVRHGDEVKKPKVSGMAAG